MPETSFLTTDTHAHVFQPGLPVTSHARYTPDYEATVEQYLEVLNENGMDRGVLVQPSFLGHDNSYLIGAMAKAPDRLRGVIVIDATRPDLELSRGNVAGLDAAGIRGVRLNLLGVPLPDLCSPDWQTAALELARQEWHLEIQASGAQWMQLADQLRTWPSKVVIDHLGLTSSTEPEATALLLELAALGHVWIKVSGPYRSEAGEATAMVRKLKEAGTTQRLVFGSDWPFTRHEDQAYASLKDWAAQQLGTELASQAFTLNAARLFGW
ncbi:amidohydrolase family protein [Paeniglutamicibacter sp. MACA_103]|uniref:amidohydrolase family protein n=1 Tax=Paeniglutamicibacter sp. MACA_103 TaxID=3377337 RepID=UPI0038957F99